MKNKSLWIIFGIILTITFVTAISYPEPFNSNVDVNNYNISNADEISANIFRGTSIYATNIFGSNSWCYQESANTSTACGGLSTGVYFNSSNWSNMTSAYDGNFSSFAVFFGENGTAGYFYINYSKPTSSLSSSLWTVKRATAINNYSIDSVCWGQSPLEFRGVVINSSAGANTNYWQCNNGSMFINVTASQSGAILYEEAMNWRLSNDAVLNGTLKWEKLTDYPVACPGSGAITQLNDSVTCSDLWVDVAGDTMTGTLNLSYLTEGSILFAGVNGLITENNANLFWNDTEGRLTIGTKVGELAINAVTKGAIFYTESQGGGNAYDIVFERHSNTASSVLTGTRSRGSHASPTIVQDGDNIFEIKGSGYDGVDWELLSEIHFEIDGTPVENSMPGMIRFLTTPNGSITPIERMRIDSSGNVNITGNITASNIITSTPVHCHSYSEITQSITNVSTYKIINFENNINCEGGIITDGDNFTIPITGTYNIEVEMFADKTGGATTTLEAIILSNGNQMNGSASHRTVNSNNEVGFFAINTLEDYNANDNISIGITAGHASAQLNFEACILCQRNVSARISIERIT